MRFRLPNPMVFLIWLTVFVPGHMYEWWVERAFTAFFCLTASFLMLIKGSPWERRRPAVRALLLLFLVQFFYISAYAYSVAFNGIATGARDYFELARYLFVGIFAVYVIRHFDRSARRAVESAVIVMPYVSIVVLAAFMWNLPVLTPVLKGVIYANTKTSIIPEYGTLRLAAPYTNPNFLGFALTLSICYLVFFSRAPLRFAHAGLAVMTVFYTGSRTAWAGTAVVLAAAAGVYAYLGMVRMRLKFALYLSLGIVAAVGVSLRFASKILENNRVRRVVTAIERGGLQEEANAAKRLEQAREALDYIARSPVFGWGPSKYETMTYVDNQYLMWVLRLGLVGTSVILAGLAMLFWSLIRSARGDPLAWTGTCAFGVSAALMLLTGQFLENFRLLFLTGFLAAAMNARKETA